MRKFMICLSAISIFVLLQGCAATHHRSATIVVIDYDERCWLDGHWVYRFREGNHIYYRRWLNNRWEEERREAGYWEKQKWERKFRSDRDDGRRYEHEERR